MDKNLQFYSRNIIRFVVLAMLSVIFNPVIVKTIEYFQTGTIVKYRWDLPIPYASPFFDLQVSPAYEIMYITFALSFVPDVFFAYSPDFLFMGMCIHIHGLFKELECRFKEVGTSVTQGRISKRQFRDNYKHCIDFQNEIYAIVTDTQNVFGNIFFTQFIGTIIIVCSQAFLGTQVRGNKGT